MTTTALAPDHLVGALRQRYATKKFDPQRAIPAATWQALEQALVLAPSSNGIQPWRFVVVTDRALRERLLPHARNQRQVVDASHLVVFAARAEITVDDIDRHLARTARVREVSGDSLQANRERLTANLVTAPKPGFHAFDWSRRQTFIALGGFLTAAALLGVDVCPMEGFDPAAVDEALGLDKAGYRSVALAPAGYRAADDRNAALPKVRFAAEDVIVRH